MADEAITECEQCGVAVLNPDRHAQWHQCGVVPTASAASPTSTSSPPSWWRQMAAAHDQAQVQKRNQCNHM